MEEKKMTNTKRKNIVKVIEFIICLISVAAFWLAILTFVGMVEGMSISYESAIIFIACIAWMTLVGLYMKVVNR
jgi:hypothetical protein